MISNNGGHHRQIFTEWKHILPESIWERKFLWRQLIKYFQRSVKEISWSCFPDEEKLRTSRCHYRPTGEVLRPWPCSQSPRGEAMWVRWDLLWAADAICPLGHFWHYVMAPIWPADQEAPEKEGSQMAVCCHHRPYIAALQGWGCGGSAVSRAGLGHTTHSSFTWCPKEAQHISHKWIEDATCSSLAWKNAGVWLASSVRHHNTEGETVPIDKEDEGPKNI